MTNTDPKLNRALGQTFATEMHARVWMTNNGMDPNGPIPAELLARIRSISPEYKRAQDINALEKFVLALKAAVHAAPEPDTISKTDNKNLREILGRAKRKLVDLEIEALGVADEQTASSDGIKRAVSY